MKACVVLLVANRSFLKDSWLPARMATLHTSRQDRAAWTLNTA